MEGSLKETPYEKRIQRLMTGEDGDQYGFYINITDNIVREVKNPCLLYTSPSPRDTR